MHFPARCLNSQFVVLQVSRLAGEAVDSGRRQEARVVGAEQAAEKALAETAARIERRLEDGAWPLNATRTGSS